MQRQSVRPSLIYNRSVLVRVEFSVRMAGFTPFLVISPNQREHPSPVSLPAPYPAVNTAAPFPSTVHPATSASASTPRHSVLTDEDHLREALKRCPPATFEAVRSFRATGDYAHLPTIVTGVIARFVERELRDKFLLAPSAADASSDTASADKISVAPIAQLRLVEDLGLDSLTMMEIVILTEDVFPVTINNDELRHLRTLGDVTQFIECKLRGVPLPASLTAQTCTACTAVTPPAVTHP